MAAVEWAVMVTLLGVEPQLAKLVLERVTVGASPERLRVTGPALGLQVNLTVVVALPGEAYERVMDWMGAP